MSSLLNFRIPSGFCKTSLRGIDVMRGGEIREQDFGLLDISFAAGGYHDLRKKKKCMYVLKGNGSEAFIFS